MATTEHPSARRQTGIEPYLRGFPLSAITKGDVARHVVDVSWATPSNSTSCATVRDRAWTSAGRQRLRGPDELADGPAGLVLDPAADHARRARDIRRSH